MTLDPVFLSRVQFAFVIGFHIVFPAFTIEKMGAVQGPLLGYEGFTPFLLTAYRIDRGTHEANVRRLAAG